MKNNTIQPLELDLFGEVATKVKKTYNRKTKVLNPFEGCKADTIVVSRHPNLEKEYPGHLTLLTDDFDHETGEVVFEWNEADIKSLWRGLLESHFSQLRQTTPDSALRNEILQWQESDDFKTLCNYLDFDAESLKVGVISAMKSYDLTKGIKPLLKGDVSGCKAFLLSNPALTNKDRNSLRFQNLIVSKISETLGRKTKTARLKIMASLSSEDVVECANIIGVDMASIRNKVRYTHYIEC